MAYSFSQLQTYTNCPLKYRFEKIDKIKPDIPNESLHLVLWSCVHDTLEQLYKQVSDLQIPSKENTIWIFKELRNKEIERVISVFERNPFDNETLEIFFHRGIEYINYYYDNYHPFDQAIAMKMEMNIAFEMDEWIKFRWKIDRLDINDKTMIINDYKTSKSLPKDWNNTIEDQITLYSIWIQQDYWKQIDKMIGRVIYLHLQREHEREITQEKIESTKQKYFNIIKEIEQKKLMYEKWDEECFEPKPWFACNSCVFKQLCPIYKHQYMKDETVEIAWMWEKTIKNLIEEYAIINERFKQTEWDKKMFASILTEYAKEHWYKKLYGKTKKLSITNKETYSINKDTIPELEEELLKKKMLKELSQIDYHKLWKKIKNNELEYEEFKNRVTKKSTTYISRTSNLKENEMDIEIIWE